MDSSVLGFLKCMDGYIWSHLRYQTQSAPTRFREILRYHGYYARRKKQNHLFEIKCAFSGILCMIKSQLYGPNKSLLLHGEADI